MVRKVILIGFIGLLIALSNAMKDTQSVKTFTFNGKNVGPALKIVNDLKYTNAKKGDDKADILCPNTLKFYCQTLSASACVIEEVKDMNFEIPEKFAKANAVFENGELITCEQVASANLVELSVFKFISTAKLEKQDKVKQDDEKKAYCEVTTKGSADKMFYVPEEQSEEKESDDKKWKTNKENLQYFASSKKFTIKNKEYTVKCENVATFWQRWRTWIIILTVLAAVIGVCYWFLCCDEDDDDEGKDENKAADP